MPKPQTQKPTLTQEAAAAIADATQKAAAATARIAKLGLRKVRAAVLRMELDGYVYGPHAKDANGKTYPLQADKSAAILASYAAHKSAANPDGVLPFTVTAFLSEDGSTVALAEARHRIAHLPDDYEVTLNVLEGTPLDSITTAARSNGEGMGFTMTAAIEQTDATVRELCKILPAAPRTGRLADLPLPKPGANKAYNADANGNPFNATAKVEAWTGSHFTGEGLAKLLGLSSATLQRCMDILSGLHTMQMGPRDVAGMRTEDALLTANAARSIRRKIGKDGELTDLQSKTFRCAINALKSGKVLKNAKDEPAADGPGVADCVITGAVKAEKPPKAEKKTGTPKPKRSAHERIVDLLRQAGELAEKTATEDADEVLDFDPVRNWYDRIRAAFEAIESKVAAADAKADAEEPAEEEDAEDVPLTPEQQAVLDKARAS